MPHDKGRPGEKAASRVTDAGDTKHPTQQAVLLVDDEIIVVKGAEVALRRAGYPLLFLGTVGGWSLSRYRRGRDRLPGVLSVLKRAHFRVLVVEGEPRGGDAA